MPELFFSLPPHVNYRIDNATKCFDAKLKLQHDLQNELFAMQIFLSSIPGAAMPPRSKVDEVIINLRGTFHAGMQPIWRIVIG
ncbi:MULTISPECIES: hypothetical protein [Geobacteraceae]|uniref:hypothetical protein n=1 Tax=Geobacteraceae TaxID=213422 RepID=UPI001628E197|nr:MULTISPECIES: hypothetical protein [Geobacteraceae]